MVDYTELVKDLQYLAKVYSLNEREEAIESKLAVKAADAIKELLAQKERYKTAYIKAHGARVEEIKMRLNAAQKWISTTDRLPEKDGAYLVCYGNGLITTDTFMTFEDGRTKWYDGGYDIGGITHWMPLPEKPKERTISHRWHGCDPDLQYEDYVK